MKRHALRFVQRLNERAEVFAHDALERQLFRRHDIDVNFRARSDAATSSPMKLAPTTTARCPSFAAAMIERLSASERR